VSVPAGEPAPAGRALRLWGLAAGATGVVALGVGVGFGVHGAHLSDEISRPGARYDRSKVDAGTRANILTATGLVTGVVLVGVGGVLYWRGHARDQREHVAIAPLVSDDLLGVALAGALP
jgi:hypothetical protein